MATASGDTALAAARRWCDVVGAGAVFHGCNDAKLSEYLNQTIGAQTVAALMPPADFRRRFQCLIGRASIACGRAFDGALHQRSALLYLRLEACCESIGQQVGDPR